jgi:S-adenosylmethionine synthetase
MKTTATTTSRVRQTHVAEWVSPGHPDRLADAVADRIVRHACALDPRARVGVEVALHRRRVFVDGRVAARGVAPAAAWLQDLVRDTYAAAGYGATWRPAPEELTIDADLLVEDLGEDERAARGVADDQSVVVGWAGGDARTAFLPPAHYLAEVLGSVLWRWRAEHADAGFGPDFKVLPQLDELEDGSLSWRRLTLSIQHRAGMGYEAQHRCLLPVLREALGAQERNGVAGVASTFAPARLHLNGFGAFERGGPMADNGLSGKKLVIDHYGPGVPIGGGALYGKDLHKVDRIGALRARQWALQILQQGGGVCEARTRLVWSPGDGAPSFVEAQVRDAVGVWRALPATELPEREWFSIERSVAESWDRGPRAFAAPGAVELLPGGDYSAVVPSRGDP